MDILNKHVDMLGLKVRDKVTGFEGVATSISFDLFGCVQVVVTPAAKDGKVEDSRWHDINRLIVLDAERAMPVPAFRDLASSEGVHQKGPAEKPYR